MNYKDLGKRDGRRCIELGDTKKDWHFVLLFGMGGRHFSFLSFSFVFLLECIRYMADDDGGGVGEERFGFWKLRFVGGWFVDWV